MSNKSGWIQKKPRTLKSGKVVTDYIGRITFPGDTKETTKSFSRLGRIDQPGTAEHWLHEQRQKIADGKPGYVRDWTVHEWSQEWLKTCTGIEKGSTDAYTTTVNLDIRDSWLGDKLVSEVDRPMVGQWITDLLNNRTWADYGNLAPSTVANRKIILSMVFAAAVEEGLRSNNPTRKLSVSPDDDEVEQIDPEELPTREQIWTLYEIAQKKSPRIAEMIIVAAGTGMRPGELVAVRESRIKRDNKDVMVGIHIRDAKKMKEAGAIFGRPKTPASKRYMPTGVEVADAIDRHLALFPLMPHRTQGDLIFRSPRENAWPAQSLADQWDRVRQPAGLPTMRFYILRHYYVSVLISGGASPKLVMARVGHKNSKYTLERYARLWPHDDNITAALSDAGLRRDTAGNIGPDPDAEI